jgi:PelA/Pel-15E family pectate lyase
MLEVLCASLLLATGAGHAALATPAVEGRLAVWHPITLTFQGPEAAEADNSPNPFFDIRLNVVFLGPARQRLVVPGFFDGDGRGGPKGRVWRVRFSPEAPGTWRYEAAFRTGPGVAIQVEPDAGKPLALPDLAGSFVVSPRDAAAPGFLKWGRLRYVGKHYLKFHDGPYWIRGGTDEPENFLGYAGFDRTRPKHRYAAHVDDWHAGDPDWGDDKGGGGKGRAIIGALNSLAKQHVNSIYFMTMNVGGDGKDVWPWIGPIERRGSPKNDHRHFDTAKLRQWEIVLNHAERLGIFLHLVLSESETANKRELDDGELGPDRKLYYREMIARFGHHLALQWNLCEEYNLNFNFGPARIRAFADYLRAVDPYDHPITVHSAGNPVEQLRFTYGDPRFSMTSIQLGQKPIHEITEAIWRETEKAGRPLPVSLDEFTLDRGQRASHIPVDDAEGHRREKIWPTYFSGGMLEFILEDLLKTDNFKTPEREKLWRYLWYARRFMEEQLPFWEMQPADELSQSGGTIPLRIGKGKTMPLGPQVFARRGEVYAVYLPTGSPSGTLDVADLKGVAEQRWFNPRTGAFEGGRTQVAGSGSARWELGTPPSDPKMDWVVLIRKWPAIDTSGFRDSIHHWRKIRDTSRFIQAVPDQPSYAPTQVREIVGNILLFQRMNGGWPKDYDMLAVLTDEQRKVLYDTHGRTDTSFDNHNLHSQVDYLAHAYHISGEEAWRDACLRGLDFMFAAQLPNGGFPQSYPRPKGFSAYVTFNDGVTIGVLNVLQDIAEGLPHWNWLDDARRQQARAAVARGTECILKCQIRVGDRLTGWCQQHDPTTYAAASARTFELASICPQDSTEIVELLMRIDSPSERIIAAVDAAVVWLRQVQLQGIRTKHVPAPVEVFLRHTADFDVVVVADPKAPPIWARHYEIGTNKPIFAGRDGIKRYELSAISRERRTGTPWYGRWPQRLLKREYQEWRKKLPNKPPSPAAK